MNDTTRQRRALDKLEAAAGLLVEAKRDLFDDDVNVGDLPLFSAFLYEELRGASIQLRTAAHELQGIIDDIEKRENRE